MPLSEPHRLWLISRKRLYLAHFLKTSSIIAPNCTRAKNQNLKRLLERGLRALLNDEKQKFYQEMTILLLM